MFPLSFSSNDKICYLYVYSNFCKQEIYFRLQNGISCANESLKFNIRRKERACTNLPREIKKNRDIYSCSQMFLSLFIERDKYWLEINRTFSICFLWNITIVQFRLKKKSSSLYIPPDTENNLEERNFIEIANTYVNFKIGNQPILKAGANLFFKINNFQEFLSNYFSIKIINRIIVPIFVDKNSSIKIHDKYFETNNGDQNYYVAWKSFAINKFVTRILKPINVTR